MDLLTALITPALLLAVIGYFTHFFGKIITDPNPFMDDRKWGIEIAGVAFMLMIGQGVAGIALALYLPHPLGGIWAHIADFLVASLVVGILGLASVATSQKVFHIAYPIFKNKFMREQEPFYLWVAKYVSPFVATILITYICTIEYMSGEWLWVVFVWALGFQGLMQLAMLHSYRTLGLPRQPVDIHFNDGGSSMEGVWILKVNEDNIRVRAGDSIVLLNKDQVRDIVMKVPDNRLPEGDRIEK